MSTLQNAVCWAEIPVTDLAKGKAFYDAVLQTELELQDGGPNMMAVFPPASGEGISGHLYPGKPAPRGTGNTIHLVAQEPLEIVMERVIAAGGEVLSPALPVPSGHFFYAYDPDGNSVGFFYYS